MHVPYHVPSKPQNTFLKPMEHFPQKKKKQNGQLVKISDHFKYDVTDFSNNNCYLFSSFSSASPGSQWSGRGRTACQSSWFSGRPSLQSDGCPVGGQLLPASPSRTGHPGPVQPQGQSDNIMQCLLPFSFPGMCYTNFLWSFDKEDTGVTIRMHNLDL